ncbi:LLM class flavin-dependent oxidoreductase [Gulosibacter sp. 10]|uniref:LLM class flavin-dependent oxidoreductase n=1 Tax=Gulosibacter sp. 10 TaxID=1255570 RepID=UPI00097F0E15|nr:LLM class flavin-dependent oxidoreductase [Gulosibacter sp. 10]SJM66452.1 luciferase family protein [Gulosibacter sp. 10]
MVKVIGLDIIDNSPSPADGVQLSAKERFDTVLANAERFEALGFDGFAVGERHHHPFISSSPPVLLSNIAARTSRIRLFTGVTLLSVLDPVRVAEDYATLDHLSDGRLELIVGKGNGPQQTELFGISRDDAWRTEHENYRILRQLWSDEPANWEPEPGAPTTRPVPLRGARISPQPLQPRIRTWHGSSTSAATVELAAEYGDPIWVANVQKSIEGYEPLVRRYREAWAELGRDPREARVGAGFSLFLTDRSQEAVEAFRPVYERHYAPKVDTYNDFAPDTLFHDYDDYLARSSALIGSPQQAVEKLARYAEVYGLDAISIPGHRGALTEAQWLRSLELFRTEVLPEIARLATVPSAR